MRRGISAAAAALLCLCLALLAGCGEKDEPETTGPLVTAETTSTDSTTTTSTIENAASSPITVEAFLSSPNAARVCDELLTPGFLRKAYGDRAGCLAARKPASLADPNSRQTVGNPLLIVAEPEGGIYDGQKLRITLVKQDDLYLIDSIKSNAPVGP